MRILAVETSCDETAAAVVVRHPGDSFIVIERSIVASQAKLHEKYGGVYPEVASREHIRQILPVIAESLNLRVDEKGRLPLFSLRDIDLLAVTHGPGLVGSLLVGTQTVATLALATGVPLVGVHHLAGHIYASWIRQEESQILPQFPLMSLIVSGGHTLLLYMRAHHEYEILGQTRDDAIGEAFDKVAKMLDLGYPGGPRVSELAQRGNRQTFDFPLGLVHEKTLDFSYSGLKTAVLRAMQAKETLVDSDKANIAASFERAAIEALLAKITPALDQYPVKDFVLGGGVAANSYLRSRLQSLLSHRPLPIRFHVPPVSLCTDNAAVIGAAAAFQPEMTVSPLELETYARLPLVK